MDKPYWYAYTKTKKWRESLYKLENSKSKEELKEAAQNLLIGYDSFLEKVLEDDGK